MFKRLIKISDDNLSSYELLKVNLLNKISLYCIYFVFLFDISYIITGRYPQMLIVSGSAVAVFIPTILFQLKKWYTFARLYFSILLLLIITLTCIYNIERGEFIYSENMLLALAPMIVILFERKQKDIVFAITTIIFFWLKTYDFLAKGEGLNKIFISSSMIYLVVILGTYYFINSYKKALRRIYINQNLLIEQLAHQKKKLEKVNQTKNKLFSIVAHDLRKPVHMLSGLIQLDEGHMLSKEENDRFKKQINENIIGINSLIENLLAWAKSQMEGFKVSKHDFNLLELIQQEGMVYKEQARIKGVNLQIDLPSEAIHVHTDPDHVSLVVRNIMSNSIKFTPRDGQIDLSVKQFRGRTTVTIKDNGMGMDDQTLHAIQSRSYLVSKKGTEGEPGSGLGLSLCVDTLQKIGGKLTINSVIDQGSEFVIEVPNE